MTQCPLCGEAHELSQCPRWKLPKGAAMKRILALCIVLMIIGLLIGGVLLLAGRAGRDDRGPVAHGRGAAHSRRNRR